jgi:hypothetical protein
MFCIVKLFVYYLILPSDDKLMQLVIIIEAASPSAQMVIVCLNQLGFQKIASQMAYMYVFQYIACIITITMFATMALQLIYHPTS